MSTVPVREVRQACRASRDTPCRCARIRVWTRETCPHSKCMHIGLRCALENLLQAAAAIGFQAKPVMFPHTADFSHIARPAVGANRPIASGSKTRGTCMSAPRRPFGILLARDAGDNGQRVEGGRLWQRMHLWATAEGIAMHPLNPA